MNVLSAAPLLNGKAESDRLELTAAGAWTAAHAAELERLVRPFTSASPTAALARIDISAVRELDTLGAWLLERLSRCAATEGAASIVGVPDRYRGLLAEIHHVNRRHAPGAPAENPLIAAAVAFERFARSIVDDLLSLLALLGRMLLALGRALARPRMLVSIVHHLDRVAWRATPIVLLITFLIGGVIAQQGIFHFRKFGADDYVVDLVSILVLREIGVLLVAIMVAGRSGSSHTAELGSMTMREEIDALRTMGLDPMEVLIVPRILSLVVGLPILAFLGSISALTGGGLVAWLYGGMNPEIFVDRIREAVSVDHFKVGMIKAPFMALAIGVVACTEGLRVKGSAESLGLQTTTSVVKSIFLVIVLDGVFAVFFASIGI